MFVRKRESSTDTRTGGEEVTSPRDGSGSPINCYRLL